MSQYWAVFRIKIITGLQYRAAAWAGIATQFAWGVMTILMFRAFYQDGQNQFPMTFSELTTYLWLQQAFLSLYMAWYFDQEIFQSITSGNVSYELCRPIDLYLMWFIKNVAVRVSRVMLRCLPILLVAFCLPKPFQLMAPESLWTCIMFMVSMVLGLLVLVAFSMLIYIATFYTMSSMGIRILATSIIEFLAGSIIPIPFFPPSMQKGMLLLPFASIQNTPFQIYNGMLRGKAMLTSILLQLFWLAFLFLSGKWLMKHALKNVIIQGG